MLIKQGMTAAVLAWLVLSGCGGAEPSGGEAPGGSMLPGSGVTGAPGMMPADTPGAMSGVTTPATSPGGAGSSAGMMMAPSNPSSGMMPVGGGMGSSTTPMNTDMGTPMGPTTSPSDADGSGDGDVTMPGDGDMAGAMGDMAGAMGDEEEGDAADAAGGASGGLADGACCSDGDCICRDEPPSSLTSDSGPYDTESYDNRQAGCIYYPTDAEPPFSAIAISDGFIGTGGCGVAQTGRWGNFLASWGIVTMIIHTGGGDQPRTRGTKLGQGIETFKAENGDGSSPLSGKLSGRYATGGFSMGGGGTTYAAADDPSLKASMALMSWTPTGNGVTVPTLFTLGSSDALAGTQGAGAYRQMPATTPKMVVTVRSGHAGQPSSGGGMQGAWGLAFLKRYLDGDERWTEVLLSGDFDEMSAVE